MSTAILVPELGPSTESARLARWLKHAGDAVSRGDVVAEIETDKATMEVEAEADGRLSEILIPEGSIGLQHEQRMALLVSADAPTDNGDAASPPAGRPDGMFGGRIIASPLAKKVAAHEEVDLKTVTGTGPKGRILVNDVRQAATRNNPAPSGPIVIPQQEAAPPSPLIPTHIPLSPMRATIARRLTESKSTVPHFYLSATIKADSLVAFRARLNDLLARDSEGARRISVNDIIVKAAAIALRHTPQMNVIFSAEGLIQLPSIDVGIAVSTDEGLVTPVIRGADARGLANIAAEAGELAERGRQRKLKPHEYQGGSLSISNLGMFGVGAFVAIINPPQSAILAVGAIERRPWVDDNDVLGVASVMNCTLSVDHRAIDGALAARWMGKFRRLLEEPETLVL